jgi:peptide/nickel transport system permease protein
MKWRVVLRTLVRTRTGLIGLILVGLVVAVALVSLVWTPYDPTAINPTQEWLGPFRGGHLLGTDDLGRDILSQLMVGAQTTLLVSVGAAAIAGVLGLLLAVAAASTPRRVGEPIARLTDLLVAFPALLLAIILAAVYGGSTLTAVVAIGIGAAVQIARVTRTEIGRIIEADYVLAARAAGASRLRIIRRHVLPNVASTIIVQLSLIMALAALAEAALSYLGYGTPAPTPSWGRMLQELQTYIQVHPLVVVWPGVAIAGTVLGFNLLGDGLREASDPRLRTLRQAGQDPGGGLASVPELAEVALLPRVPG